MSEAKTYVFGQDSNSALATVLPLLQQRGIDPAYLMGMMGNNNGGFFGNNALEGIIALIVVAAIFGNGNFGFGGFGGNNGAGYVASTAERDLLAHMIQRNGTDLSQLAQSINCSTGRIDDAIQSVATQLCNLASQNGISFQQVINAIQAGDCDIASKIASCCCDLKNLVATQGYENQLRTVQQTDDIKSDATAKFNVLSAKIDAQTQIINDKFCQLEMREMQRENQNLRDQLQAYQLSASQQTQTANIVSQLKPCPTPAYIVPNPFGCGCRDGYPYGGNCGNNGCGC